MKNEYTEEEYKRIESIYNPVHHGGKKVVVVGLGSGGSQVVVELAKVGLACVGVDLPGEELELHNVVRHALGHDYLGIEKTTAMKDFLNKAYPHVDFSTRAIDVVGDQAKFRELLEVEKPDLVVVGTDNEKSKFAINEVAHQLGIPQVGAGVLASGKVAEVYIVRPGGACYACIADSLDRSVEVNRERNIDYSDLDASLESRASSALNVDIRQAVIIQVRVILSLIQHGNLEMIDLPNEVNYITFTNRFFAGQGLGRPLAAEFYAKPVVCSCMVCQGGGLASGVDVEAALAELE